MGSLENNNIDRELCKKSANAFYRAACLIESIPEFMEFKDEMLSAYAVNLMLSCELYLKYILLSEIENIAKKRFKTHSLVILYTLLKEYLPEIASRTEKLYYLDCEDNAIHSFENVLRLNEN